MKAMTSDPRRHAFCRRGWLRTVSASLAAWLVLQPALLLAQDPGWPRVAENAGARMVYYQPQIDEWKDHRELRGDLAVSVTPPHGQPAIGVLSFTCQTQADVDARTVVLFDITVTSARFPGLAPADAERVGALARELAPKGPTVISLDRLVATLDATKEQVRSVSGKTTPPKIFVSTRPALLLFVDGDPVRVPIENTGIDFVVNTTWNLFVDQSTGGFYLLADHTWLTATALDGAWSSTTKLPAGFSKLPKDETWAGVRQAIPAQAPRGPVPDVLFTPRPAELILFDGAPVFAPVTGTALVYAKNTESPVFFHNVEHQYYYLVAGRWFRAATLDGPWSYANDDLPADFGKIPPDSPMGWVRASVPGTQEAEDAILLASIPTTTVIDRATAEAQASAVYDGDPKFEPIQGTSLEYATNTPDKVIQVNNEYYLCQNAVWFKSGQPTGPWKTTDSVPKEIYSIPPTAPVYNVTYVYPSNPTPTTIESNSTAGYVGAFVLGGLLGGVIGYALGDNNDSHYYYPPVYRPPGYAYPVYRPRPYPYGCGAVYNPYRGAYAVGRTAYGPYSSAGSAAWYNPRTGSYGRAATVQTPHGGRTVATGYNPYTGAYGATRQGSNASGQWGTSVAQKGNEWARAGHVTTGQGTTGGVQTSGGQYAYGGRGKQGSVVKTNDDLYAAKDGNVYKRGSNGSWQKYDDGGWSQVEKSSKSGSASAATTSAQQQTRSKTAQQKSQAQSAGAGQPPPSTSTTKTQPSRNSKGTSTAKTQPANRSNKGTPPQRQAAGATRPSTAAEPATMDRLNREAQGRQRGAQQATRSEPRQRGGAKSKGGAGGSRSGAPARSR